MSDDKMVKSDFPMSDKLPDKRDEMKIDILANFAELDQMLREMGLSDTENLVGYRRLSLGPNDAILAGIYIGPGPEIKLNKQIHGKPVTMGSHNFVLATEPNMIATVPTFYQLETYIQDQVTPGDFLFAAFTGYIDRPDDTSVKTANIRVLPAKDVAGDPGSPVEAAIGLYKRMFASKA